MFDDQQSATPATSPAATPADGSAQVPTISATSSPTDGPSPVVTADTTMSSTPVDTTQTPQDTGTFNASVVSTPAATTNETTTDSAPALPDTAAEASTTAVASPDPTVTTSAGDDLADIKQQALKSLSPLLGHLDQTPEEKFRTTMMMIQASDDQTLVKDAYAAAQNITDEKAKAQALLDVVNEINYFTQHGTNQS